MKPKMAQAVRKGILMRSYTYNPRAGTAYHWTYVVTAVDPKKRKKIADGMIRAVKCKKISYSNTAKGNVVLFDTVKKCGFDCMKLKKKVTTNCTQLVSVAFNYAGIRTPRKNTASTLPKKWSKIKGVKVFPYKHGKTKMLKGYAVDATQKPKVHIAVYIGK